MQAEMLEAGFRLAAVALIFGAFILLLGGAASALGYSFRSAIEPFLSEVREGSSLSRPELADASVKVAIGFAGLAMVFDERFLAVLLIIVLWQGRPTIRRLTSEENRLLALVGSLSIDVVIGFYLPIVLAQFLLFNIFIAASMLLVVIALSWPAGGDSVPGRKWRLAPVR